MKRTMARLRGFAQDDKGLALTEYLVLLGLMTGGVVLSISLFATALAQAWTGSMQVLSLSALSASAVPAGAQTGPGNETVAQPPAQEEEVVTASVSNPSARDDDDDDDDDDEEARDNGNRGNSNCRGRSCRDRD